MVAAPSSRGGGSKVTTTTANNGKNGSHYSKNKHSQHHNVKFLLSRGHTSRFLPPGSVLRHLTAEETEKDLRHFQAYHRAVISYRQQYYVAVNPNAVVASNSATSNAPYHAGPSGHPGLLPSQVPSLPVRIDPEEEKRLALLRRKIARAECLREDLEQQYVALRAHYVQYSQEVRQLAEQVALRGEFLQSCVRERATTLGLMRARLQMTRDVLAALQRRTQVLEQQQQSETAMGVGGSGTTTAPSNPAAATTADKDSLLEGIWNQVEEELKKQQRKLAGSKAKPMVWPCTKMPSTPFQVPILLSNTSDAPEKSVAFGANGIFGSKPRSSLVWITPELQLDDEGTFDGDGVDQSRDLHALREEASFLQNELDKERLQNQELAQQIARGRSKNDEWVAMICLVRQETESVLHRHNVVLESELAQEAAERLHLEQQERAAHLASAQSAAAPTSAEATVSEGKVVDIHLSQEVEVPSAATADGPDEDNDGDDEGSEGEDHPEDDDQDEGNRDASSSTANKRAANEGSDRIRADEDEARRKRRKL